MYESVFGQIVRKSLARSHPELNRVPNLAIARHEGGKEVVRKEEYV